VTPVELAGVLRMLNDADPGTDVRPALALLAARELAIEPGELSPALRRTMLLLAAGGDPHRELELDGRAVHALATELDRPERREIVERGLDGLRPEATDLPRVAHALNELSANQDLAWRAYACALLADELGSQ
jgi:hypothetical protein